MRLSSIFFILAMVPTTLLWGQGDIPIGTWRSHLSYRYGQGVANTPGKIFCLTDRGLFFFDQQEGALTKLTEMDGLSGVETATIGYGLEQETLLVTYLDGSIDVIKENSITPFDQLKNSGLMGEKGIQHISFYANRAHLSSQLGLIVFDLDRVEFKEAYTNLGEQGTQLPIHASATFSDSLFLATPQGIIVASLKDDVNRLDYRNWRRLPSPSAQTESAEFIVSFNQRIYSSSGSQLYSYQEGTFEEVGIPTEKNIIWMMASEDRLVVTTESQIQVMDLQENFQPVVDPMISRPSMATIDGDGKIWVADQENGLVSNVNGQFTAFFPDGPFTNQVFSLSPWGDGIAALPGGYDNNKFPFQNQDGFFLFQNGEWTNFNSFGTNNQPFPPARDLVDLATTSTSAVYVASFGWGLIQGDGANFEVVDESSPGSPLLNSNPPGRNTQISSIEEDASGNLWVANYAVSPSIHRLSPAGEWQSYTLTAPQGAYPLDLTTMPNADIWLRPSSDRGGGIVVFNPEVGTERLLSTAPGGGGLPSNGINDIELDKAGQVWIATDNGVAFYPSPFFVLSGEQIDANLPVFESQFLLRGQKVNTIEVDGGNRKWMGTNDGVWLFKESGEEVVFRFTAENSPLLSNQVLDILVQPKTGEVFFATAKGIVSFRSTATQGTATHGEVKIFPNPVPSNFTGIIGITGLASGAVVKITDVAGRLVREVLAEGGTATWDALDLGGNRVSTGVYIVFSSTRDGQDTFIGKIAVIN